MRRSEMVQKLANSIMDCMSVTDNMMNVADCVLAGLENEGMIPPCKNIIVEYGNKEQWYGINLVFDNCKWETEEEINCGAV